MAERRRSIPYRHNTKTDLIFALSNADNHTVETDLEGIFKGGAGFRRMPDGANSKMGQIRHRQFPSAPGAPGARPAALPIGARWIK
jgi:hypothetical protein